MPKTKTRKLQRNISLIAAIPIIITVLSGSLYSLFQYFEMDYFWFMTIHTRNFFFINLQSLFTPFVGSITIFAIFSGLFLFLRSNMKYQD